MPFSFAHWRLIEFIAMYCNSSSLENISFLKSVTFTEKAAKILMLTILPEIKTVMHMVTRSYEFVSHFCNIAQQTEKFPIPFIDNLDGETPLHLALKGKTENTRVAEYFLKELLPSMPLDHHGRAIVDVLPECIERDIKGLGEYLDSRFITTK